MAILGPAETLRIWMNVGRIAQAVSGRREPILEENQGAAVRSYGGRRHDGLEAEPPRFARDGLRVRKVARRRRERILSTEGNRHYPGRYHVQGETGILYTSLSQDRAIREIERHASRASLQRALVVGRIRLRLPRVLDLTDSVNLRELGLSEKDLVSPDYSITQAISLEARRAGFQGLLVPSATGQGENLIVFENNLGEGCLIEVEEIDFASVPRLMA